MKLDYVKIVNFRSIKESTIKFAPNCRILVEGDNYKLVGDEKEIRL